MLYILVPLFFVILPVANVCVALLAWRARKAPASPAGKVYPPRLAAALVVVDGLVIALVVTVCCAEQPHWYFSVCYILAGLVTLWLLYGLLLNRFSKKRFAVWLACAVLTAGGFVGGVCYDRYIQSITLQEQFDYRSYLPFQADGPVQALDEPASLQFSDGDRLPRMDGATALYPVYAAFCQAVYPSSIADGDLDRTITCSTTSGAYRSIVNGTCDIIFVGGPSEEQEAYAAEQGVELVYTPIGREAFVFFVHPDNPLDSLGLSELRGIYAGQIRQWSELGVDGLGEILAYQREEGSGSQTALRRFVMGDTPLMPAETEKVIGNMGGIVEQVSAYRNHRNAIGYSFRFYSTSLMKGFQVKLLSIDGIAPTVENIENGSYPLASSFYAVTRSDADENTRALLEWICGAQGQALVEQTGYTPVGP